MSALLGLSRVIDGISTRIGRSFAWLILLAVIISTVNALVRKILDTSSNSWLELQWVLFGAVFLFCAAWTLENNEMIRIDIVNALLPKWLRNTIDVVGHLFFLLPFCVVMIITSWPFFLKSFNLNEQSLNAGGLPQWPAKFLIFAGFVLLFFQGISELIKRIAIMRGDLEDRETAMGHQAAAEAEAARLLGPEQAMQQENLR